MWEALAPVEVETIPVGAGWGGLPDTVGSPASDTVGQHLRGVGSAAFDRFGEDPAGERAADRFGAETPRGMVVGWEVVVMTPTNDGPVDVYAACLGAAGRA